MKLVIAEKPSVGAAIAAVIGANEKRSGYFEGSGYLVSWCIGHLIMTTSINPRFAEQRQIGLSGLTRPAFSLSSITKR